MVVVWKDLEESDGQGQLFNKRRCFFYITNIQEVPAEKIVLKAILRLLNYTSPLHPSTRFSHARDTS